MEAADIDSSDKELEDGASGGVPLGSIKSSWGGPEIGPAIAAMPVPSECA